MGQVIALNESTKEDYIKIHAEVWDEILALIARANMRNYTIFLREPENLLFAYWEYHGTDLDADMKAMGEEPIMQKWWAITDNMQTRLPTTKEGEQWARMREVFHTNRME